jgi:putative glutamine amidotransferase
MPDILHGDLVDLHSSFYTRAITAAGGLPVQLPREADPGELVLRLDAVIIAGGEDVNPRLYGARPGVHSTHLDPDRDSFEIRLVQAALEYELPLLGICRGCQVLNVAKGGTLVEHLPVGVGESHSLIKYPLHARVHELELAGDDLLPSVLPAEVIVNSFHHQAVDKPGEDVEPVAFAPDGVCEAIRIGRRALGVQWHPEYHTEQPDPIFLWLIALASEARSKRMNAGELNAG